MTLKEMIEPIMPPILIRLAKRLHGKGLMGAFGLFLSGDYQSWDTAMSSSTGYDSEVILDKTKTRLLKVKNGEAACERDSVLVNKIQYSWPLLASLMWAAAQNKGKLNVLDFGGSFGSTYYQNRAFLRSLPDVRWNIVEQPRHVVVGKQLFEDERLRFYLRIEDCLAETTPNVIVLSSVLQYLEAPYDWLNKLSGLSCSHLIIDRTPFWGGQTDRLCVQNVPASIYPAKYPCWIFSTERFRAHLNETWRIVAEFDSLDDISSPIKTGWQGMTLERISRGVFEV